MNEFNVIIVMNEAMISLLKKQGRECTINLEIKECLSDEAFFFKISKQDAYKVLSQVGVSEEQLGNVYKKLVAPNMFHKLVSAGKIKDTDNLVVKYNSYSEDDFLKRLNKHSEN